MLRHIATAICIAMPAQADSVYSWGVLTGYSSTIRLQPTTAPGAVAEVVFDNKTVHVDEDVVFALTLDGLTVDTADWWFNLRPSNTEPLLRLNVEAGDEPTMQRVRDEAHRTAIAFHRKRRGKRATVSTLDAVPGLGPAVQDGRHTAREDRRVHAALQQVGCGAELDDVHGLEVGRVGRLAGPLAVAARVLTVGAAQPLVGDVRQQRSEVADGLHAGAAGAAGAGWGAGGTWTAAGTCAIAPLLIST